MDLKRLAQLILNGDALSARQFVQDAMSRNIRFSDILRPDLAGPAMALAAGLAELFAERCGQPPPEWTLEVGAVEEDVLLVRAAEYMPRLRHLCETEGPLPLRRRRLLAPPDYLSFA